MVSQEERQTKPGEDDFVNDLTPEESPSPNAAAAAAAANGAEEEQPLLIPYDDDLFVGEALNNNNIHQKASRRKMDLMLCGRETCKEVIRERVVGNQNNLEFEGPATGQVCYVWNDMTDSKLEENKRNTKQSVLVLVKRGDEELIRVAAEAIKELSKTQQIEVHVAPELCAKLKHYHGVDDDDFKLFEPAPVPGFGGNHIAMDDELMGEAHLLIDDGSGPATTSSTTPDLICTLGGDGLLMHASMMFQGSCPPILCVAGGSLGFLTRFTRDEMVEAIKIALGLVKGQEDDYVFRDPTEIRPSYKLLKDSMSSFNLGLGNRICISMRMRLDVRVINREGVVRARFNVLNEVVIDRGASPYLAALECFVDDLHLTTVQADGIIFAT
jgi:NAD kinase